MYFFVCVYEGWLFLVFCVGFSAGELEKQQGAKTYSVKSNGTQRELSSKQDSLSGVWEQENKSYNTVGAFMTWPTIKKKDQADVQGVH